MSEKLFLDYDRLYRYITLLESRLGPLPKMDYQHIPLTFFNTLNPFKIYELPQYRNKQIILRGLKFRRERMLSTTDPNLTKTRKIIHEPVKKLNGEKIYTFTVEEKFCQNNQLIVKSIKRNVVR